MPKVMLKLGKLEELKKKLKDTKPAFALIKAYLMSKVVDHFQDGEGPSGKWQPRSQFTFYMAKQYEAVKKNNKKYDPVAEKTTAGRSGIKIHTGTLMKNTGRFRNSFVGGSATKHGKNFATVGTALKTKDGKYNIGAIQHFGVSYNVTSGKQIGWFSYNFGIDFRNGGRITIPPRPVLWMSREDQRESIKILAEYLGGQAA